MSTNRISAVRVVSMFFSGHSSKIFNWIFRLVIFQLLSEIWNASAQYLMASLSWNPKHWFWEYLVGNNNMRRRRMGEMQTKFHQKTYICLLSLVFNRWQYDFFPFVMPDIYTFLLSFTQKFNWLQNTIFVQSWFTRL